MTENTGIEIDGTFIQKLLTDLGITRDQLATMIGVNSATIFRWIKGVDPKGKEIHIADKDQQNLQYLRLLWEEVRSEDPDEEIVEIAMVLLRTADVKAKTLNVWGAVQKAFLEDDGIAMAAVQTSSSNAWAKFVNVTSSVVGSLFTNHTRIAAYSLSTRPDLLLGAAVFRLRIKEMKEGKKE